MAQAGPTSPSPPSDTRENTPELPISSSTESSTSEDATLASSADLRGSSSSAPCWSSDLGESSADRQSSSFDQPSSSFDQPSSSFDQSSSVFDQDASTSLQPGNPEEIRAEIEKKLKEKSETSYRILLVAADIPHHVRSVCDIGSTLKKAGHNVLLVHRDAYRATASEYGVSFMEIDDTLYNVFNYRPTKWIGDNLEKFHAQPERLWANWSDDDKIEFARIVYEFNVTNRIFERKLHRLEKRFDLIIGNLETRYPCTFFSALPFIPVSFMNPLSLHRYGPPPFSGYPTEGDSDEAKTYRRAQRDVFKFFVMNLHKWWRSLGITRLDNDRWWIDEPKEIGIYRYPEKLEYTNIGPKTSKKWFRVDPDCEFFKAKTEFELPNQLKCLPGKIIYISLGKLGQAEPEWTEKFLSLLEPIPHGFIYSEGENEIPVPGNVWAAQNLVDAAVIPIVDLVITHGGNNSLMQIIYHKKLMIVIPFFIDQYDNAQRVVECGIGQRLDTTFINTDTIMEVIEDTLNDDSIPPKLAEISTQMMISNSRLQMRYKIEEICRVFRERREERNRDP